MDHRIGRSGHCTRVAAVLEVFGVYVLGGVVVSLIVRLFNLQPVNPMPGLTVETTDAELVTASWQIVELWILQYGGWFLLIIPISWWQGHRGPAAFGLTRAGHTWSALVGAGLATTAATAWFLYGFQLVDTAYGLGETVAWRQALFDMPKNRWEYWLFTGVMSWAIVPVVEELFFRGYIQRRLARAWGHGPAIVGTALFFTTSHSQYWVPNPYNTGILISLFLLALGFGIVFAATGSLFPSMLAHGIINFPMTPSWQALALAAAIVGAVLVWRRGLAAVRQVFVGTHGVPCVALGTIGIVYAVASQTVTGMAPIAGAMIIIALVLELVRRRGSTVGSMLRNP